MCVYVFACTRFSEPWAYGCVCVSVFYVKQAHMRQNKSSIRFSFARSPQICAAPIDKPGQTKEKKRRNDCWEKKKKFISHLRHLPTKQCLFACVCTFINITISRALHKTTFSLFISFIIWKRSFSPFSSIYVIFFFFETKQKSFIFSSISSFSVKPNK